jgi:ribA/ribD-fused uncharacterized protein
MNVAERLRQDGVQGDGVVTFYGHRDAMWGVFSNFSDHQVWLPHPFRDGELAPYATTEHRYQAMKATTADAHDAIRAQPTAYASKEAGGPRSKVPGMVLRPGWGSNYGDLCWYVMFEAVLAKALQHDPMASALARTGSKMIYEDSPVDDIWGWRFHNDYRGKNLLGRVLMEVREVVC